ncbi:hypothetical protein HUJ04_010466 [Dendroctonus ponderosae]|nr:hypothetical protein HUJ04_010466 [Dendroctonus ponderosae]
MHKRAIVVFLGVCFLIGIGQGLPVASSDNVEKQEENANSNCIQTPWGCIDITDPSFRPRVHLEVVVPQDGSEFASQHAEIINLEVRMLKIQ